MISTELVSASDPAARPILKTAARLGIPFFKVGYFRWGTDIGGTLAEMKSSLQGLLDLAKEYPEDRMVQMLIGQVYTGLNKFPEAKAAFERAIQLDGSTPRVYTFLGNIELLKGDYAKARRSVDLFASEVILRLKQGSESDAGAVGQAQNTIGAHS